MKLAKTTALQSLNQNRITEKALSRINNLSAHNMIVPFVEIRRWEGGFQNFAEYVGMRAACLFSNGNNPRLVACDPNRQEEFVEVINRNRNDLFTYDPFLYPVCCIDDTISPVKNARIENVGR